MKTEQRIVRQVQNILKQGRAASAGAADVAEQYGIACAAANERLQQCRRLLAKGMMSEAMHIAENKPILLDVAACLDFVGVEEWAELCAMEQWPQAERIDAGAVDILNENYGAATKLEPAIRRYRQIVRQKDTEECVRLLRQISLLDPTNPNWRKDLQAFEKKRVKELAPIIDAYATKHDEDGLVAVLEELQEDWIAVPPAELISQGQSSLRLTREKKALERGQALIRDISDAYSAQDYDGLEMLIREYNGLLVSGYFTPPEDIVIQFEDASSWFVAEQARRNAEQSFAQDMAALDELLDRSSPTGGEEQLLLRLQSHDRPLPDGLVPRTREAMETYRINMRRKNILIGVACALAAIVVSSSICFVVWRKQLAREKERWVSDFSAAYKSYNLPEYSRLVDELPLYRPALFGKFLAQDPDIVEWLMKRDALAASIQARLAEYDRICGTLSDIKKSGYKGKAQTIEDTIASVSRVADSPDKKAFIDAYRTEWRATKNAELQALIDRLEISTPPLTVFQKYDIDDVAAIIEATRIIYEDGAQIEAASTHLVDRYQGFASELSSLDEEITERRAKLLVVKNATTATCYTEALEGYATEFPEDFVSTNIAQLLSTITIYPNFMTIWQQAKEAKQESNRDLVKAVPVVREAIDSLADDDQLSRLKVAFMLRRRSVGFAVPSASTLQRSTSLRACPIYIPEEGDTVPSFSRLSQTTYGSSKINEMKHCTFINALCDEMRTVSSEGLPLLLLRKAREVAIAPVWKPFDDRIPLPDQFLNSCLKLQMTLFICRQIESLLGKDAVVGLSAATDAMAAADGDISFLCIKNPKLATINRSAEIILNQHFSKNSFVTTYLLQNALTRTALKRGIKWVGTVSLTDAKKIEWKDSKIAELWAIRSDHGRPRLLIVGQRIGNRLSLKVPLVKGEPLFAPADGSSTKTQLQSVAKALGSSTDLSRFVATFPDIWPADGAKRVNP